MERGTTSGRRVLQILLSGPVLLISLIIYTCICAAILWALERQVPEAHYRYSDWFQFYLTVFTTIGKLFCDK